VRRCSSYDKGFVVNLQEILFESFVFDLLGFDLEYSNLYRETEKLRSIEEITQPNLIDWGVESQKINES
jgi:hypothetical protein